MELAGSKETIENWSAEGERVNYGGKGNVTGKQRMGLKRFPTRLHKAATSNVTGQN